MAWPSASARQDYCFASSPVLPSTTTPHLLLVVAARQSPASPFLLVLSLCDALFSFIAYPAAVTLSGAESFFGQPCSLSLSTHCERESPIRDLEVVARIASGNRQQHYLRSRPVRWRFACIAQLLTSLAHRTLACIRLPTGYVLRSDQRHQPTVYIQLPLRSDDIPI